MTVRRPKGEAVEEREKALIREYFPWRGTAQPSTLEEQRVHVCRWLEAQVRPYRAAAMSLLALVVPILAEWRLRLTPLESSRFLYRIDASNLTKSPASILEKMARQWMRKGGDPPIKFDNLHEMSDLARFRIVANFLSDVRAIRECLESSYRARDVSSTPLPERQLYDQFSLKSNRFEDLIALDPRERETGERCCKGCFRPKLAAQRDCQIEVQIVTALQEAWDKKDHFLIYERRRTGHKVDPEHERISYALSEQLYLADYMFDRLKLEALSSSEAATPPSTATLAG